MVVLLLILVASGVGLRAGENQVPNPGFESGSNGWRTWSRSSGAIVARVNDRDVHTGRRSLRLEHSGTEDWSLEPAVQLDARAGDLIALECWVKLEGEGVGTLSLCASTWDAQGRVVAWSVGERTISETRGWQHLATRIVVPSNVTQVRPRLIGYGPLIALVDDYSAIRAGNISSLSAAALPPMLQLSNVSFTVTFNTADATFTAQGAPGGRLWVQKPFANGFVVAQAAKQGGRLEFSLVEASSGVEIHGVTVLDRTKPEMVVELSAENQLSASISFPHPFTGQPGDYLVVPMNEGISYPVDDLSIPSMHLIAYGGHGICMSFYGVTDGTRGQMAILETPDDASIRIVRLDGRLAIQPEWDAQLGQFGYTRRVRFVFFEQGGHVAMAKRYRAYAKQAGLLRSLEEKRRVNSNVDRLVGAVNVWCWDRDAVGIVQEMQAAGIDRILWSNQQSPEHLKALNALGVLTSSYDIYQDVMAVTNFPKLRWIHPDWTTNAWPRQIILDRQGRWLHGWGVESREGPLIPCGVLCDRFAPEYARQRIAADLSSHPYLCRFIDTTTAAPWNECYSAEHPMSRTESRKRKMELLRLVSDDENLVTGSETGHDAAVPFVHYFEGMLSLGPYRVPDAGRKMSEIWTNIPEAVAKFQLGQKYRLPLWELVYHDCVVAQWYWGDYNNKLPALWDKRDLFNVLYGVPQMFMFDRELWKKDKDRFVSSYRNTCPSVRKVGYQEMLDHRFLSSDRDVQETSFANGVTITVNFGSVDFRLPDGRMVSAGSFLTQAK